MEKIDSVVVVATNGNVEGEKANGGRGGDVGFLGGNDDEQDDTASKVANSSEDSDEADRYPVKTFFRCGVGVVARILLGHSIHLHNSACKQSDSFSDLKRKASVGRKTASRAQRRKLMIVECANVDNRQGRKRHVTG